MEYKICSVCNISKPLSEFYSQKKYSKRKGEYIYYNPECKECTKNRFYEWVDNNKDQKRQHLRNWRNRPENKQKNNKNQRKYVEKGKYREWQQNNTEKIKQYQITRNMHKSHDISDEELNELYEYADSCCMYCSMTEEEHKKLYNQRLHRDHAYNEGSNGIDNCILACKSCNSEKHEKDWIEWYTPENPKYSEERFIKIYQWLHKFH